MTTEEFSNEFDVLYNNIMSNEAPGLNEYEKSVFLTKAQDEIVKNHFLPEGNPKQKGFDDNQKRQIDFSNLIRTEYGIPLASSNSTGSTHSPILGDIDPRGYKYGLPDNILYIINESISLGYRTESVGVRQILPLKYNEYSRLMSKPFKEPLKFQAWRLMGTVGTYVKKLYGTPKNNIPLYYYKNPESSDPENSKKKVRVVELVLTSNDINKYGAENEFIGYINYSIRYVRRPQPIILTDFTSVFGENISIHGETTKTECELDNAIHEEILQRAVELAKIAWAGDVNSAIQAGQRSE